MKTVNVKAPLVIILLTVLGLIGRSLADSESAPKPFASQFPGSLIYPPPVADAEIRLTIRDGKVTEYRLVPVASPVVPGIAGVPDVAVKPDSPDATAVAAGRAWVTQLPAIFASSLSISANDIESNTSKPMKQIMDEHTLRWNQARSAAFDRLMVPVFDGVIPAGTANPTPDQRKRYAALMRAVVQGMQTGSK